MFLILLLLGILPLKQHRIWTQSGGDFTLSKYLGAVCLVYAIAYLIAHQRTPRHLETSQARWYLLFFVLVFISYVQGRATSSTSIASILMPTSVLTLGCILLSVVDNLKRFRLVLLATVCSVGWASLYVIREWSEVRGWESGFRGEWVVGDSNHFAVSTICAIPIAWYLSQTLKRGWERWLCRSCALLALAAIIIGASRGGLLGLTITLLFLAGRSRKRFRNVVILIVLVVSCNIAYPHSPLWRLLKPDVADTGSEVAHRGSWSAGLKMMVAHPITGVGGGAFRSQMPKYAPNWYDGHAFMAHSAYISLGAEMGIPGLAVFLIVLARTYRSLTKISRLKSVPRLITHSAVALQAALVGASVSISFISAEHHEYLWLIIFESMCLSSLARRLPAIRQTQPPERASNLHTELVQI